MAVAWRDKRHCRRKSEPLAGIEPNRVQFRSHDSRNENFRCVDGQFDDAEDAIKQHNFSFQMQLFARRPELVGSTNQATDPYRQEQRPHPFGQALTMAIFPPHHRLQSSKPARYDATRGVQDSRPPQEQMKALPPSTADPNNVNRRSPTQGYYVADPLSLPALPQRGQDESAVYSIDTERSKTDQDDAHGSASRHNPAHHHTANARLSITNAVQGPSPSSVATRPDEMQSSNPTAAQNRNTQNGRYAWIAPQPGIPIQISPPPANPPTVNPPTVNPPRIASPLVITIPIIQNERDIIRSLAEFLLNVAKPVPGDKFNGIKNTDLTEGDVLYGRGDFTTKHKGNKVFRGLVSLFHAEYVNAPRGNKTREGSKTSVAQKIVILIRSHRGRFLKRDDVADLWFEQGDAEAIRKTLSALRELNKKTQDDSDSSPVVSAPSASENGQEGTEPPAKRIKI